MKLVSFRDIYILLLFHFISFHDLVKMLFNCLCYLDFFPYSSDLSRILCEPCFLFFLVVLASDVVYNEKAIDELLYTLMCLCSSNTTVILSGELRNGKKTRHSPFQHAYNLFPCEYRSHYSLNLYNPFWSSL